MTHSDWREVEDYCNECPPLDGDEDPGPVLFDTPDPAEVMGHFLQCAVMQAIAWRLHKQRVPMTEIAKTTGMEYRDLRHLLKGSPIILYRTRPRLTDVWLDGSKPHIKQDRRHIPSAVVRIEAAQTAGG